MGYLTYSVDSETERQTTGIWITRAGVSADPGPKHLSPRLQVLSYMSGPTHRFTHDTTVSPQNKPSLYQLGQRQAKLTNERYHYLRAAITGKFALTEVPGDISRGQLFPRAGILFDQYVAFKLEPVFGVKLHPRGDGTIHPKDPATTESPARAAYSTASAKNASSGT